MIFFHNILSVLRSYLLLFSLFKTLRIVLHGNLEASLFVVMGGRCLEEESIERNSLKMSFPFHDNLLAWFWFWFWVLFLFWMFRFKFCCFKLVVFAVHDIIRNPSKILLPTSNKANDKRSSERTFHAHEHLTLCSIKQNKKE